MTAVAMTVVVVNGCSDLDWCLTPESWYYNNQNCDEIRNGCWVRETKLAEYYDSYQCVEHRRRYPWVNPYPEYKPDYDGGAGAGGVDGGDGGVGDGGSGGGAGTGGEGGTGGGAGSGGSAGSSGLIIDAGADGSAAATPEYIDKCIPRPPAFFEWPQPVWFGPTHLAPENCPLELGAFAGEDFFDVRAAEKKNCPTCTCAGPTGKCSAKMDSLYLRDGSCSQISTTAIDFTPPANWNGSCSAADQFDLSAPCSPRNGAGCIKSIQTGQLQQPEQQCEPVEIGVPNLINDRPSWGQVALSCTVEPNDDIEHADWETCIPTSEGWRSCIHADIYGVHECEEKSDYRDRFIVYPKDAIIDNRTCSACECSPVGGSCRSDLSVSADGSCAEPVVSVPVDSTETHCGNIPAGTPKLGSKQLGKIQYVPGTCDVRGGEPSGTITFDETYAVTWCCLRLDYVRPPFPAD